MKRLRTIFGFFSMPLLAKDLTEQAARKRTYVVRMAYAVLMFGFALLMIEDMVYRGRAQVGFTSLGHGREIFMALVFLQFAGIALFMPALMAGAITQEKERDSLTLLLITDLKPRQIIMQKYLGRLVPMFTFLLMCVPLMAVAYSLGGVDQNQLISAMITIILFALQTAALSLMLSAFCRGTSGAFVLSYIYGALLYFGPFLLIGIIESLRVTRMSNRQELLAFSHLPIFIYADKGDSWLAALVWSIPALVTTIVFLVLARVFLTRRATTRPRNLMLGIFRFFDRLFERMNFLAGNVRLMRDVNPLPGDRPVAWWELTRRALAKPHYLFRILTVAMTPTLILISLMLAMVPRNVRPDADALSGLLFILWPMAALLLAVQGAGAFAAERSRQTLDVLLVSPMSTREIVIEKTAALRRLFIVWVIPLGTIIGFETWWEYAASQREYGALTPLLMQAIYLICSALTIVIYMPLIAWVSMWIGMRVKSYSRAIITAVAAVVIWCVGPIAVGAMIVVLTRSDDALAYCVPFTPAMMIGMIEFTDLDAFDGGPLIVAAHFAIHASAAVWFRYLCITRADRYLGRVPAWGYGH